MPDISDSDSLSFSLTNTPNWLLFLLFHFFSNILLKTIIHEFRNKQPQPLCAQRKRINYYTTLAQRKHDFGVEGTSNYNRLICTVWGIFRFGRLLGN